MKTKIKIAIDVMGNDNGPGSIISGASISKERYPKIKYVFFGDQELITKNLKKYKNLSNSYDIVHTSQVVLPEDKPSLALRNRKNTSMGVSLIYLGEKKASALVSAGNTGALMAMSKLQLRMLDGISRPAIASTFPHEKGEFILLDLGANTDCNSENLVQFAIMGTEFAKVVLGRNNPKIAILNIGTEQDKGKTYINEAANLLEKSYLSKNFIGYIEGNDMTKGLADVVVADGFSGNIALKTAEGVAVLCSSYIKKIFESSILGNISYFLLKKKLSTLKEKLDPRKRNGALFLGLNGLVVKSHGSADALGFAAAIDIAYEFAQEEVATKITKSLSKIDYKV
jgi:glycerol-3-phosphate acyltransferase PlsX